MAKILQAHDALNEAKSINGGLGALSALMQSAKDVDAPPLKELSELLNALHDKMDEHLNTIGRCLDS